MKNPAKLFAIIVVFLVSCKGNEEEINQLNSDLQIVNDSLALYQSAKDYHTNRIDTLLNLIQQNKLRIYNDSIGISSYLSEHKTAVACIAGGYVSASIKTDFDTKYPEIVEDLAEWGIVVAILYYAFNKTEVDEVYNKSVDADNKKNQYYAEIASYQQDISKGRSFLRSIDHLETDCQNRAVVLRQRIEVLQ